MRQDPTRELRKWKSRCESIVRYDNRFQDRDDPELRSFQEEFSRIRAKAETLLEGVEGALSSPDPQARETALRQLAPDILGLESLLGEYRGPGY